MAASGDLVNVTLTLKKVHVKYLTKKHKTEDIKRSPYVRRLIDQDMKSDTNKA